MPLWVASIVGGLIEVAGTIVGKVLLSLGLGYAVFTGVDTSIGWARDAFFQSLAGLPAGAVGVLALLKIGVCVSMLVSALTTRLTIQGLTGGTLKRMVQK